MLSICWWVCPVWSTMETKISNRNWNTPSHYWKKNRVNVECCSKSEHWTLSCCGGVNGNELRIVSRFSRRFIWNPSLMCCPWRTVTAVVKRNVSLKMRWFIYSTPTYAISKRHVTCLMAWTRAMRHAFRVVRGFSALRHDGVITVQWFTIKLRSLLSYVGFAPGRYKRI